MTFIPDFLNLKLILGVWGQPPGVLEIFVNLLHHGACLHVRCFPYFFSHVLGLALPLLMSLIFPSKGSFYNIGYITTLMP